MTLDIDKEKREASQAADLLADWEEKVKTCKKTQSIISHERDPDGELAHLRSEVHRMQVRAIHKFKNANWDNFCHHPAICKYVKLSPISL